MNDVRLSPIGQKGRGAKHRDDCEHIRESLRHARVSLADLADQIDYDSRRGRRNLEEHVRALGRSCPRELIESCAQVSSSSARVSRMLESTQDGLVRLLRKAEE